MSQWIQDLKSEHTAFTVARALGKDAGHQNSFGPCPACGADKRGGSDRRKPCGTDRESKGWHCWVCSAKGDAAEILAYHFTGKSSKELDSDGWEKLRQEALRMNLIRDEPASGGSRSLGGGRARPARVLSAGRVAGKKEEPQEQEAPDPSGRFAWYPELGERCFQALWEEPPRPWATSVRNYLRAARRLSERTIKKARIGIYVDADGAAILSKAGRPYLTLPLPDRHKRDVNIRFRSVPVDGTCEHCTGNEGCRKCKEYRVCMGRPLPLYGSHNLTADKTAPVIVTEGEFDVLAMDTYGFEVNVVSGTGGAGTWKDEWLDELEPYEDIVGLYDADEKGSEGWTEAVKKLGTIRCRRAILPCKDANEALQKRIDVEVIEKAIASAKGDHGIEFRTVEGFSAQLEELISNPGKLRGITTGSENLDLMLGGIRPELTIVSGETGTGKTTFTTWLLYEQACRGVGVAVTSFEQQPIGTVQKLLRMRVGQDFTKVSLEERTQAMQEIGNLPLYILDHYGQIEIEKIMETMRYAKRRLAVRMFLVDHLGFLIKPNPKTERTDIENAIRDLAIFAKNEGISIFLIVHPSNSQKESFGRFARVSMENLKGASALRQDADNVLIVTAEPPNISRGVRCKREWPQARLFLDKCRSEFGIRGSDVAMAFDPGSCVYADSWDQTPAGKNGWLVPRVRPYQEEQQKADDDSPVEKPKRPARRRPKEEP